MEEKTEVEELAERIYCRCMDMDAADYKEDRPDDAAGLETELEILRAYGSGYIWQSLEILLDQLDRGENNGTE